MKSKTLYTDFMLGQFKRQGWIMALMALAFFLAMPVRFFMIMDKWSATFSTVSELQEYYRLTMIGAQEVSIVVAGAAFFCGIFQFWYLHSEKQADFYCSLPVKRERLFMGKLGISYLDFVLPYTVMWIFNLVLGWSRGLITSETFLAAGGCWLLDQIAFLLIYLTTAIAMLMTGRLLVGIMGAGVLLGFGVFLEQVITGYQTEFFSTFVSQYSKNEMLNYLAPIYYGPGSRNHLLQCMGKEQGSPVGMALWIVLGAAAAVGLFFLGRLLIKKRPAEAAGRSMAFSIAGRVIHILLSIGGALWFGLFVKRMVYSKEAFWLITAALFGGIFLYLVIQFIYTLDIRKVLNHKWQILVVEGITLLVSCLFYFDLLGYDTYLPDREEIGNISISPDNYESSSDFYFGNRYVSSNTYRLDNMRLQETDGVYKMLEQLVSEQKELNDTDNLGYWRSIYARYTMESGREVNRRYQIDVSKYKGEFIKLFEEPEFRKMMYPLLGAMGEDVGTIRKSYAGDDNSILFKEDDPRRLEFMEIFKREMNSLPGSVFTEETPLASLEISFGKEKINLARMMIYPSCKETLAYLRTVGLNIVPLLTADRIRQITVYDYRVAEDEKSRELSSIVDQTVYADKEIGDVPKTYSEKTDIEAIAPALVNQNYTNYWLDISNNIYADVTLAGPNGYDIVIPCSFREGYFPDILN